MTDSPARPDELELAPDDAPAIAAAPQRPMDLALAVLAGLCWSGALALLLFGMLDAVADAPFAPERVLFYLLTLTAAVLTFVPVQRRLNLPGLAFEGIVGTALLLYMLAFVPPPTDWLLALPDAPVYVLLALAVFWAVSAILMPLTYAAGRVLFRERARQYDRRRARRQAHEIGLLAALCVALAGLRVLTPLGIMLLALILVVVELLFLSFIDAEV